MKSKQRNGLLGDLDVADDPNAKAELHTQRKFQEVFGLG